MLSDVFRPIGDFFSGALNYAAVENENAHLRNQVGGLRRLDLENADAERQLEQLTTVEHLPYLRNLTTVIGDVISEPPAGSNFYPTIEIDRGTADGVGVGMPVVAGAGLVGEVLDAGRTTSVIRLITDARSQVGVRFADGTIAIATGQGMGDPLTLGQVTASGPLPRKGQLLVTSGLQGAAFPAGIPVGTVSEVKSARGSLTFPVSMVPVARLSGLQYVAVVQWLPAA